MFASCRYAVIFLGVVASSATGQTLTVIGYNAESGDADPATVANRISAEDGCDIWGICEVRNDDWATQFETAAEDGENANFERVLGTSGAADKMVILYDADRFTAVGNPLELDHINIGGHVRSPLVVHLRENASGTEFLFMVNHLYRSRADRRHDQAALLNEWASQQLHPVVAVGDYNFDWDVTDGENDHDEGYDRMVAGDVFLWMRPDTLVKTQASPSFDSVLDFVFVSGGAQAWAQSSEIIVVPGDFPDDSVKSDHRPVRGVLDLSASDIPPLTPKQRILQRIAELEAELQALRALVEQLPD